MNILIDSNIFIPLEISSVSDIEPKTPKANELYRKAKEIDYHIFLLDVQKKDIENDKNLERKKTRLLAFEKYELLKNIEQTDVIKKSFPAIDKTSHDYIDISLLNALCANDVSILVTDDEGIHKKAKKIGKEDLVYYLEDALDFINGQLPKTLETGKEHPVIKTDKCFNLNLEDSFFDTLRNDYSGFDNWFKTKCQNEHRDCLVIKNQNKIAGLCIYKFEKPCYDMIGNVLKICTFKLAMSGNKFGELLLKNIFNYCYKSSVDWIYVTAYEKNYICQFFENFGFEKYKDRKEDTGEFIYRKKLYPKNDAIKKYSALEYHIKYGPRFFNKSQASFLVPVISNYHDMLFPETINENLLFPSLYYQDAFSNAIRKAYICASNTNLISDGDILFFYKSHGEGTIEACGIVERLLRSNNPDEIISIAGKRTVYKREEIAEKCSENKDNLVLLFRQTENLLSKIELKQLIDLQLIKAVPQTITKISEEAKQWILQLAPQ